MSNPYGALTNYNRGQRYAGGTAGDISGLGDALASAIWSIKAKRDQDKLDEIANGLLATETAPKAERVGPIVAADAPRPTAEEESARNARLGFSFGTNSTRVPNLGGKAALDMLLGVKMKQAQIAKAMQGPVPKAGVVKPVPVTVDTPYGPMRPRDAAAAIRGDAHLDQQDRRLDYLDKTYGRTRPQADSMKHLSDELQSTYGQPLSFFTQSPEDHKHMEGDVFSVEGDAGTVRMPAATYRDYLARFQAIQGGTPRMVGGGTAPAGAPGMSGSAVGSDPGNAAPAAPAATGGKVKMLHPNGTPGMVPAEQVDAAMAQGYRMAE